MDPLRPFATLIRSLSVTKPSRSKPTASTPTQQHSSAAHVSAIKPPTVIQERLRSRLASLQDWDPHRARELFVECTLLAQLGEELETDPAFAELVRKVGLQLADQPQISDRLDQLLHELASNRPPR